MFDCVHVCVYTYKYIYMCEFSTVSRSLSSFMFYMFKEKWSCCGPGAAEWTRLVIDRWHYRQFGEVSNRMSSSLAARWLPLSKHFWASAEQGGGVRGGVETAH